MKKEKVIILGSTGSIGKQSMDVLSKTKDKEIYGLACNKNIDILYNQVKKIRPKVVAIYDEEKAKIFEDKIKKLNIKLKIYKGLNGLNEIVSLKEVDFVIISVVGMIGIRPTISAIKSRKKIALANKETLVCAGKYIMNLCKKYNVDLRPIDSEHSAIWQCLQGEKKSTIKKLLITASGGPFFGKTKKQLTNVKLKDALKHPTWAMGKKITIDSSTLVNKALEIIEAHFLFDIKPSDILVVVQRESLIHSMVLFNDGAIKAQLGMPSMRVPIAYAIYKNNRVNIKEKEIDFSKLKSINIDLPDTKTFEAINIAYMVLNKGGLYPCVFNALDEVCVDEFINGNIKYLDIVEYIKKGIKKFEKEKLNKEKYTISDIDKVYKFAKEFIMNMRTHEA